MKTYLYSDPHYGHVGMTLFKDKDGNKIRPWTDVEEMNKALVENWNSIVKDEDKVYVLGDVAFNNYLLNKYMSQLKGTKVLIKGNHDTLKPSQYLQWFKDIRAYHILDKILLSHIPVHPQQLTRWKGNVHGHLHNNVLDDPRYYNVSVERINYTPISFEVIREYFANLQTRS